MDLVVDEMVQLQHVDVADRHLAVEGLAGAPVVERHLARRIEARHLEHAARCRTSFAPSKTGVAKGTPRRRFWPSSASSSSEASSISGVVAVDRDELVAEALRLAGLHVGVDRLRDLLAEARRRPAEMGLEDLADIHAARHAERIEHDVDMRAVVEERHVLDRHDARDDALVAVAAGHLVAGLDLALHRDEDLDHLHDAGRKLVAALQLLDLVEEALLEALLRLVVLLLHRLDLGHASIVGDGELPPLRARILVEQVLRELRVLLEALRPGDRLLAVEDVRQARIGVAVEDRLLVVAVLRETLDLLALDRLGALVLVDAVAVEHAHFDDACR